MVKDIPPYVFDPVYKMTHIIAARRNNGSLQFRQCFKSKGAAVNRMNKAIERYPDVEFKIFSINDLKN